MLPSGLCPEPGIEFVEVLCECEDPECPDSGREWYCAEHWDEMHHECGPNCEFYDDGDDDAA
jgi:hypothetical protein